MPSLYCRSLSSDLDQRWRLFPSPRNVPVYEPFFLDLRTLPLCRVVICSVSLISSHLRDHPDITVADGVGERSGALYSGFPWGSECVTCPLLRPLYKERRQRVTFSYLNPSRSSQNPLPPSSYSLFNNTSLIVIHHEQILPFPETPCPNETRDGSVGAGMAEA